ncbi:mycothiol synthase [Cryobacterium glaciale]|uniref:Mycothiol acetyltransferase n=1 Tax=Cryobacterium glaciale TaxID=1259145 RepID=A0A4R8UWR5_9MICO|nr:mycothiol synthase [Cryobacterium glaciale]TFB71961.1 mycothiol synthase [Cryobacterium glaciale]
MSGFRILSALKPADAAGLAEFHRVAASALAFDGYAPFNEQALFDLQAGLRTAYLVTVPGMAVSPASDIGDEVAESDDVADEVAESDDVASSIVVGAALGGRGEIDLVISPEYRRRGYGRDAVRELAATEPNGLTAWSHGDHPAARALATELRFVAARTLLELRKPLVAAGETPQAGAAETSAGTTAAAGEAGAGASALEGISAFRVGSDDAEWVALNALVFATHPEQGAMTEADLTARQAESWFNADDFLILRDADSRMIGYNWLKVDGAMGEIYVVGVHPDAAGRGLGRALMQAGLHRLVAAGCTTAALYVEADSLGPVHLYRALGFADHTVDVQYRRLPD